MSNLSPRERRVAAAANALFDLAALVFAVASIVGLAEVLR